jgi:hypothetical protein
VSPPEVVHEARKEQTGGGSKWGLSIDSILELLPKSLRPRAQSLLNHLQALDTFSLTSKGEIVYKDHAIEGSHIVDLLKDSFYKYKHLNVVGREEWYRLLVESNVPQSLILNATRRGEIAKQKSQPSEPYMLPPPPGYAKTKKDSKRNFKRNFKSDSISDSKGDNKRLKKLLKF